MSSLFETYKFIKEQLTYDYKGYPIQNILSSDISALVYTKVVFNIRLLTGFFTSREIIIDNEKSTLFSIGDYCRNDYYELLKYVRNGTESTLLDLSRVKNVFKISPKNILISLYHVFSRKPDLNLVSKVALAASMTNKLNIIDNLEKSRADGISYFCSFCSNINDEAILDYFFKKRNVPTYTLQHGLWFIYDNPPIDAIAYENLIADKLLCWGEYTRNEFIKYGIAEDRLLVSGYPKRTKSLSPIINRSGKIKVLVLFARTLFNKNNLQLVSILSMISKDRTNVEIEFKLHPSLSQSEYSEIASKNNWSMAPDGTIQELLLTREYDCSISYNSTAYYDSYINNCISLRFKDEDADKSINVIDDSFTNVNELSKQLDLAVINNTDKKFWNNVESRLKFILGYGVNRYNEV